MECRVCQEGGENMLSPCDCNGSIKYIHEECLKKWVKISKNKICPNCLGSYNIDINTEDENGNDTVVEINTESYIQSFIIIEPYNKTSLYFFIIIVIIVLLIFSKKIKN